MDSELVSPSVDAPTEVPRQQRRRIRRLSAVPEPAAQTESHEASLPVSSEAPPSVPLNTVPAIPLGEASTPDPLEIASAEAREAPTSGPSEAPKVTHEVYTARYAGLTDYQRDLANASKEGVTLDDLAFTYGVPKATIRRDTFTVQGILWDSPEN